MREKIYVIDGRHRLHAARIVGVPELRVDVHHNGGFGLRVIPLDELDVDPDVQFEDTFKPSHAQRIAREWDHEKVGVLKAVTVDVPASRKADIKMALDGLRRNVGTVERFRARVLQGDPAAIDIDRIVREHGWKIAANGKSSIAALAGIVTIERIYTQLGIDGLDRTLTLADHWRGEAQAGTSAWVGGLGLLVRDGYDETLTEQHRERFAEIVPALVIRKAIGNVAARKGTVNAQGMNGSTAGPAAHEVASLLRKSLKLRKRPAVSRKGGNAKELA